MNNTNISISIFDMLYVNQNDTSETLLISPSSHTYNLQTIHFKRLTFIMQVHNKVLIIIFILSAIIRKLWQCNSSYIRNIRNSDSIALYILTTLVTLNI